MEFSSAAEPAGSGQPAAPPPPTSPERERPDHREFSTRITGSVATAYSDSVLGQLLTFSTFKTMY